MAASFAYGTGSSWFDPTTGAVKQVSLYYYRGGTEDPITVYTTSSLSIPHPWPVLSTGYGKVPPVWIGDQAAPGYRVRVFDQWSTLIEDVDNIPTPALPPLPPEPDVGILPGDSRLYATGDISIAFSNAQPRTGFVLCNGGSIGKTGSPNVVDGGRANDDTHNLFLWLWGQDTFGLLAVLPSGRGATAEGDWSAGRAIRTPDLMGRSIIGMSPMGAGSVHPNRLAGITFAAGDQAKVGSYGGIASKSISMAEMPIHKHTLTETSHTHTGTTGNDSPDHVHSGTTGPQNANHYHNVNGITDNQGAHAHLYDRYSASGANTQQAGSNQARNPVATWTDTQGTHYHNMNFDSGLESAVHAHGFTSGGASVRHQHPFTTAPSTTGGIAMADMGGGAAVQFMQPFYQLAIYMKL